jgi:hypothetical protein
MQKVTKTTAGAVESTETVKTSHSLSQILNAWRQDVENRNYLNNWCLNEQDRAFVEMHNHYRQHFGI